MIVEMRTYNTKPGRRAEFLEIFRTRSVPAHAEIGMKIPSVRSSPVRRPPGFVFSSCAHFPILSSCASSMKARFYEGELWKGELEAVLMPIIEKYDVIVVDDPAGVIRWP